MKTLHEKLIHIEKTLREKVYAATLRIDLSDAEREDLKEWCKDLIESRELIGQMQIKMELVSEGKWLLTIGPQVKITLDESGIKEIRDIMNRAIESMT